MDDVIDLQLRVLDYCNQKPSTRGSHLRALFKGGFFRAADYKEARNIFLTRIEDERLVCREGAARAKAAILQEDTWTQETLTSYQVYNLVLDKVPVVFAPEDPSTSSYPTHAITTSREGYLKAKDFFGSCTHTDFKLTVWVNRK